MRGFIGLTLTIAVFSLLLFGSAGRFDLPFVWAFLSIIAMMVVVGYRVMDPDLRRERLRPAAGGVDRRLRAMATPFFVAHLIVAGLDIGRFHWSDTVPLVVHVSATVLLASSFGLALWAVSVNRFFSPVVRIQSERGHRLVTSGPYRWVRHPGYVSSFMMLAASALTLGSWWSLVPQVPVAVLILWRTRIEDRFLLENLAGYRAYAARVRYRFLPGVW